MPHLRRLWTGILTRNVEEAGTDSRIALAIDGQQINLPADTPQEDLERGQASLYERNVEGANIIPENLTSIRLTILGDDAWRPEHFFVWGERFTGGAIIPVAIETDIDVKLSTNPSEGNSSMPLRQVSQGGGSMVINRLLVIMTTASSEEAGTDDTINVRITDSAGRRVVDFDIPDTPQEDQETGQANLYFAGVEIPFTRNSLTSSSIQLSTRGNEAWLPASFFVSGLDDAAGRPESVVPLVHIPSWTLGKLSTDTSEGRETVTLPLL